MICIIAAKLYKRLHATHHAPVTCSDFGSPSQRILTVTAYLQGVSAEASQHLACYLICDQKVSFQLVILQSGFFCTISAYSATENR